MRLILTFISSFIFLISFGQSDTSKTNVLADTILVKLWDGLSKEMYNSKQSATKYFERLKELFGFLATSKKYEYDKHVGNVAQFSTNKNEETGIKDITLFLSKPLHTKRYEIMMMIGNEFADH